MFIDIIKLFKDYSIECSNTGKNASLGWVNYRCPFCTDNSDHGGVNVVDRDTWCHCRRCGKHTMTDLIGKLTNNNPSDTWVILNNYTVDYNNKTILDSLPKQKVIETPETVTLPCNCVPLGRVQHNYLRTRGYNHVLLEKTWGLRCTNDLGDYKYRIIAPIFLDKKLVSYQGRDYTNKASLKYKACLKDMEVVHHKHTLYGIDLVQRDTVVVVEGIADVWRLGPGAVATFGISYKKEQVLLLNQRFKKIFILFDSYPQEAMEQANNLAMELIGLGSNVEVLELDKGDPADMSDVDLQKLMHMIL